MSKKIEHSGLIFVIFVDFHAETTAEKIALGRLNKFFKESTLLAQDFIKDGKMNVETYLKGVDKDLSVTAFKRHSLTI